jgi:hypothetical protein
LSSASRQKATLFNNTARHHDVQSAVDFQAVTHHMADIWAPFSSDKDTPVLWTASQKSFNRPGFETYMSDCLRLDLANARSNGIFPGQDMDVLVTPCLHETAQLEVLAAEHRGRVFTLLQHPVNSVTELLGDVLQTYKADEDDDAMNLMDLVYTMNQIGPHEQEPFVDNIMTRQLVGKTNSSQELSAEDLEDAKSILSRKVLIGLVDDRYLNESVKRFSTYFGWDELSLIERSSDTDFCRTFSSNSNQNNDDVLEKGSPEWNEIAIANSWDVLLYDFAVKLFETQALLFPIEGEASSFFSSIL